PQNSASWRSSSTTSRPMMKFARSHTRRSASSMRVPNRRRCACRSTRGTVLAMSSPRAHKRSRIHDLLQSVGTGQRIPAAGPWASEIVTQLLSAVAHPADAARWNARHHPEGNDIAGDNRASGDEAICAKAGAADDRRVRANGHATFDDGRKELVLAADFRARSLDVSEHAARAAKDVVRQLNSLVNADVVLDLA